MNKLISLTFLVVALSAVALAAWTPDGSTTSASVTAERPAECCCIVASGQLVCTVTGEVLEECCCK